MLDIIILFFLARSNGKLAERKGLQSGTWVLYTILAWFAAELVGVSVGFFMFGQGIEGFVAAFVLGLGFAVLAYFTLRSNLQKKPDPVDDDVNRIGINDLRP